MPEEARQREAEANRGPLPLNFSKAEANRGPLPLGTNLAPYLQKKFHDVRTVECNPIPSKQRCFCAKVSGTTCFSELVSLCRCSASSRPLLRKPRVRIQLLFDTDACALTACPCLAHTASLLHTHACPHGNREREGERERGYCTQLALSTSLLRSLSLSPSLSLSLSDSLSTHIYNMLLYLLN